MTITYKVTGKSLKFYDGKKEVRNHINYGGSLCLSGTAIISLPDNLTVGGFLDLSGTAITSLPDNLTIGGYLDLSGTAITSLPDNLTVGGSIYLNEAAITSLPDNLTVGMNLDLSKAAITSLPDNLTVGGFLDLRGTAITSLPDNLAIGGSLDLEGTAIESFPDNLTVGGNLYLDGTAITSLPRIKKDVKDSALKIKETIETKFNLRGFSIADGVFGKIISEKENVKKLLKVGTSDILYLIRDSRGYYAHGNTLAKAKEALKYKFEERDLSAYNSVKLDTVMTHEEAMQFNHTVTGACEDGAKYFVEMNQDKIKDKYTIGEIIELTKGQYNHNLLTNFMKGK